ncbi:hypothetical protein [Nocardioides stalactiti]|uniref:hypothetical protein n=1 Tax=Nocardioides stalactiti TaxID=2755356 RepID=UPI00160153E4|nr:hypothetical protein [Nocardioides stalactiti]
MAVVALSLLLVACSDGDDDTDASDSPSTERPAPGVVVVHDPVGDTQDAGGDPVNIDVEKTRIEYDERGLVIEVVYTEPLEPASGPAELIIQVNSKSSFDDKVLKWADGDRPWIAGEDGVRTGCRPAAKVDRKEGIVVLTIPPTRRCLDDLPQEVEVSPMAWRGNSQDDLENVTVRLPRSARN